MILTTTFCKNIDSIRDKYKSDSDNALNIYDKLAEYATEHSEGSNIPYPTDEYAAAWADIFKEQTVDRTFFVLGFSDGRFIRKLLDNTNSTNYIYVYEPDANSFVNVLNMYDMTDFITNRRLSICVEHLNGNAFFDIVNFAINYINYKKVLLCTLPGYGDYKEVYVKIHDMISYRIRMVELEKVTEIQLTGHMRRNIIRNFMDVTAQRSVNQLIDIMRTADKSGCPAVIVSAGPSLDKNIQELKKAQGSAFIIVVDTALKAALRAEIIPDLTVCVDPRKEIVFFKHEKVKNVPAVFGMDIPHEIIEGHVGNRFYMGSGEFDIANYFRRKYYGKDYSTIATGGSVANTAVALAEVLGFRTIILIGQDLAFTDGRGHTKDAYDDENKNINDAQNETNCEVEGIYGGMVKTEVRMRSYLKWFENNIISHPEIEFIDATEGGALIHGTRIMTLNDAISEKCIKKMSFKAMISAIEPQYDLTEQQEIKKYMKNIDVELDRVCSMFKNGISYYTELALALKSENVHKAQELLEKVGEINSLDKTEPLISLIRKYAVEEQYAVDDKLYEIDGDDSMTAINGGIELLKSYIKGIDKLKEEQHSIN